MAGRHEQAGRGPEDEVRRLGDRGEAPTDVDQQLFGTPKLEGTRWRITDRTLGEKYNCFGYALCSRFHGWVDPVSIWPFAERMAKIDAYLVRKGWTKSADCTPKKGVRKLAVYCASERDDATGRDVSVPTHVAKQIEGDWWESKLGSLYRILHPGADGAERPGLGTVCGCYEKTLAVLRAEAILLKREIEDHLDATAQEVNRANDARHSHDPAEREQAKLDLEKAEERLREALKALEDIDRWISDLDAAIVAEAP